MDCRKDRRCVVQMVIMGVTRASLDGKLKTTIQNKTMQPIAKSFWFIFVIIEFYFLRLLELLTSTLISN